jgi:hypothetical protein
MRKRGDVFRARNAFQQPSPTFVNSVQHFRRRSGKTRQDHVSQAQLDELDRLTERWVADHLRRAKTAKKGKRTRHS